MGRHRRGEALHEPPLRLTRGRDMEDVRDVLENQDVPVGPDGQEYGLRVNWQSEEVKIEAAEFLVATRIQQAVRLRAAHDHELLRHPERS